MDNQSRLKKTLMTGLLALVLCASSFAGMGTSVYAEAPAAGTSSEAQSTGGLPAAGASSAAQSKTEGAPAAAAKPAAQNAPAVQSVPSTRRLTIVKYDITFKSRVRTDRKLGPSKRPADLVAKGGRNCVKVTWTAAGNPSAIDGYVVVRQDVGANTWRQLAVVDKNTTSYKDKTASTKEIQYKYTVVAYKNSDYGWYITNPIKWAGAVTGNSNKENVNAFTLTNPAKSSTVKVGVKKKLGLTFKYKDPVSKTIRWTSSNSSIAKVNSKGEVTGVSHGTVTLTGRTHTGRTVKTDVTVIVPGTAQAMVDVMRSWLNYSEVNHKHEGIIDIYNSKKPWPRGYKVKYSDEWCATCVSAAAIMSGTAKYTGRECGVPQFITYFKNLGRWEENGNIKPKPGYLIIYGWSIGDNVTVFGNNWSASHIGVVESVSGNKITVIEGNMGVGVVGRRTISKGWRFIRGYCKPKYQN